MWFLQHRINIVEPDSLQYYTVVSVHYNEIFEVCGTWKLRSCSPQ